MWLAPTADGVTIGFQHVAEPKQTKNRVHLDVAVHDLDADVRNIETLGGRRVAGYEPGGFLVMTDPEGNEFCVLPEGPWDIDEFGHADYLDR